MAIAPCLLAMLAGCQHTSGGKVKIGASLPVLPSSLSAQCRHAALIVGKGAKATLAAERAALNVCARRHRRTIKFYQDVRRGLSGK